MDVSRKPPQVVTEEKLSSLWPQPQSIEQQEGYPFHIRKSTLPVMISVATGAGMFYSIYRYLSIYNIHIDLQYNLLTGMCIYMYIYLLPS